MLGTTLKISIYISSISIVHFKHAKMHFIKKSSGIFRLNKANSEWSIPNIEFASFEQIIFSLQGISYSAKNFTTLDIMYGIDACNQATTLLFRLRRTSM